LWLSSDISLGSRHLIYLEKWLRKSELQDHMEGGPWCENLPLFRLYVLKKNTFAAVLNYNNLQLIFVMMWKQEKSLLYQILGESIKEILFLVIFIFSDCWSFS
jgi:hypothetical protein